VQKKEQPLAKLPTSVKISEEAKRLWEELAHHTGVTRQAWLETVIRREAKREGLR
jgi:predicted transcriptional regulator